MLIKLSYVVTGVVLITGSITPALACSVNLGRGWSSNQGGQGVMHVQTDAVGCPALFMVNPEQSMPAAQLTVTAAPKNGTALVQSGGVITYTPKPGFRGRDSFTVTGSGGTFGLKGRVVVTVK